MRTHTDSALRRWAEMMIAAALDNRDVQPVFDLARLAGVDTDALAHLVNSVIEAVRRSENFMTEPPHMLSLRDFADLESLRIRRN